MTIEQFLRGCFDCGYEAAVTLSPDGVWHLSVYEGANVFESRYRAAEGASFALALAAFDAQAWNLSTKDAIAEARRIGSWS